jgi:hypothetical protein
MVVKGCLLFPAALIVSFALGIGVTVLLEFATVNHDLASVIGTGVWFFSLFVILPYGSLWLSDPEEIAVPPEATSTVQHWRNAKAESKLQAAELRMGVVFGLIGAGMAMAAGAPTYLVAIVATSCAIVGMLVGFDYKRRVLRIREQFQSDKSSQGK